MNRPLENTCRLDPEFIRPFVAGVLETLKVSCQIESSPGRPYAAGHAVTPAVDIAATIGLMSSRFSGSIAICFPKRTFLNLMKAMLGIEEDEINSSFEDGAGELLNMVFGYAKRSLNDHGYAIERAIPSVIRGDNLKVWHLADVPRGIIPFESSAGNFYMEIALHTI